MHSNADEILLGAVHRGEKISDEERLILQQWLLS